MENERIDSQMYSKQDHFQLPKLQQIYTSASEVLLLWFQFQSFQISLDSLFLIAYMLFW